MNLTSREAIEKSDHLTTVIVDLRNITLFAEGHPKGAISIPFSERSLSNRIQLATPNVKAVIFLAENDSQLSSACSQLEAEGSITPSVLTDGYSGWLEQELPTESIGKISVYNLLEEIEKNPELLVLDVRESIEWETGHVPKAKLISLGEIVSRHNELPDSKPIAVICEGGIRSSTAASILQSQGFSKLYNVIEGSMGYRNGGYPLEYFIES
jgi:hydroxyacylglutathione hydrolase